MVEIKLINPQKNYIYIYIYLVCRACMFQPSTFVIFVEYSEEDTSRSAVNSCIDGEQHHSRGNIQKDYNVHGSSLSSGKYQIPYWTRDSVKEQSRGRG